MDYKDVDDDLNELYLMFSLNAINFSNELDKKMDVEIKKYAKINLKYLMQLNVKFENEYDEKEQLKLKEIILTRLTNMLKIITNAQK